MTAHQPIAATGDFALPTAWRAPLAAFGAAVLAILIVFHADAVDMATIWWTRSSFSHCLVILPIIVWLVWQRRAPLAAIMPAPSLWGLPIIAAAALGWLLGEAAGVSAARHLGLVMMLQGSVVAILGVGVARMLLFPLAYALFLVPFGEVFVPPLQTVTAQIAMALLGLAGLPAHMEGVFITTPSGYFEVAEACSGAKFLIAMVALGVLAAHLCFKTWPRRIAFVAACIVIPIIANGIRAFATIYIADQTGIGFAATFDHVIYGWFFFAFVIAAILLLAWRFFDRAPDELPEAAIAARGAERPASDRIFAAAAAGVLLIALSPMLWTTAIAAQGVDDAPVIAAPSLPGWQVSDSAPLYPWRARFAGADGLVEARYSDNAGQIVDLAIGYYAQQQDGRDLVGFGQGGLDPASEWSWAEDEPALGEAKAYRITAPGRVTREIVQAYLIGDTLTGSDSRAKLATMEARLFGGEQRAVGIVISSEGPDGRAAIEQFIADGGSLRALVDRALLPSD